MKKKMLGLTGLVVLLLMGGCATGTDTVSDDVSENTEISTEDSAEDCGILAADGTVQLEKIYEETNAVVISMVWDTAGYETDCEPQFNMEYESAQPVSDSYGTGTGYYDKDENLILVDYYEKRESKVYDTVIVMAADGVSVSLEPAGPDNDSPLQNAVIQVADANGVRTLSGDDIYTRGETGIWYDAICTVRNGLAEKYE